MKITTQQYAQVLYEMTKNKSPEEIDIVVKKFINELQENDLLNKSVEIIEKFEEIYNKENRIVKAKIITHRKINDDTMKELVRKLKERYKANKVEIKTEIDKNLKGGMKIVVGEDILDSSTAGRLGKLKRILSN